MDDIRTLANIRSAHWQPRLGMPGQVVEGIRDIDQAIRIILTTPKGTDRHRPEFGWNGHLYLDWPVNRVTPYLVREAVQAIRRWETRADLVKVETHIDVSHITLKVSWRVADGVLQLTEVVYYCHRLSLLITILQRLKPI